jgi:hypothetical protein
VSTAVDAALDHGFHDWQPQSLSMLAWAAVQLGLFRKRKLFHAIAAEAASRVEQLSTRDLALITWATVKSGRGQLAPASELLAHVARRVLSRDPVHPENAGFGWVAQGHDRANIAESEVHRGVQPNTRTADVSLTTAPKVELISEFHSMDGSTQDHSHARAATHGSPEKHPQQIASNAGLSDKDRSQLLWAFAAEAERRLQAHRRGGIETLGRLSQREREALLKRVWPEVPVLAVLDRLMGGPQYSVKYHNVRPCFCVTSFFVLVLLIDIHWMLRLCIFTADTTTGAYFVRPSVGSSLRAHEFYDNI